MIFTEFFTRKLMARTPQNGCYGAFETFEGAAAAAPKSEALGYDAAQTSTWYRDLMERVHHDDYPLLYWFEKALLGSQCVVEIGGHVGVAYYAFATKLSYPEDLRWTIVDVPSVTAEGENLAKKRQQTQLLFANDFTHALAPMDILIASGSLQYVPGPMLPEKLRSMDVRPKHIMIHKTPVIERPKGYVTLQNIGTAWCPYRIFSYSELVQPLIDMGYELVDTWAKIRRIEIPRRPDLRVEHYSGYYLRDRSLS
jgi:putative methyltransferase (TIGR04325 family)